MRGLEQFVALQPTHCAVVLVRANDALPELRLMESLPEQARDVATTESPAARPESDGTEVREPTLVDANGERQTRWIVADDEHGPLACVEPRHDAVEVHQRHLVPHRQSQADVLVMSRIGAAISVPQQSVRTECARHAIVNTHSTAS